MMKKTMKWLGTLAFMVMCVLAFTACGGDDDNGSNGGGSSGGNGSGGGNGGSGNSASSSIVGTWWIYFQSNDSNRGVVYNLLTFNSNFTGELVEEVGYGSDNAIPFNWTQSGNTIRVTLSQESYAFNVEIVETIDNYTMVVKTVVNNKQGYYAAYKMNDKTLLYSELIGTWQVYKERNWGNYNGERYDDTFDIYPTNATGSNTPECRRYEFYDDFTYKFYEYYKGDWLPHGPYSFMLIRGRIFLPEEGGTPRPIRCEVTKSSADEMVITMLYYDSFGYAYTQRNLRRMQDNGGSDNNNTSSTGTIDNPLTASQIYDIVAAMPPDSIPHDNYYAKGKICSIKYSFSAEYGTAVFDISDNGSTGGKKFTVYNAYYKANGQKWVEGNTQVSVGDEVVVAGKVVNYRGTTPEFVEKQSYVVSINGF